MGNFNSSTNVKLTTYEIHCSLVLDHQFWQCLFKSIFLKYCLNNPQMQCFEKKINGNTTNLTATIVEKNT